MKQAIVTGASRGIGKAIADELINHNYRVIGMARRFSTENKEQFMPERIDFSDKKNLEPKLKAIHKHYGTPDAIIANHGIGQFGSIEEFSENQIDKLFTVNVLSHITLIKTFLPQMKKKGRGDIIFICSEAALQGKRKGTVYCATKFALKGFAEALRDECRTAGIRVSSIHPGLVKTDFFETLDFTPGTDPKEHILPEDIAKTVSLILNMRDGTVFQDISLMPQQQRIEKKTVSDSERLPQNA